MPAVSPTPTQLSLSVQSVAELESVEASQFKDGDLAYVFATGLYYSLDLTDTTARNGTTVLYMRNSNPAFGAPAGTPGRWELFQTTGPVGPTGPAGPTGPTAPIVYGKMSKTTTQSIPNNALTPVTNYTTLNIAQGITVNTATGQMTVQQAGRYEIEACVVFATVAAGPAEQKTQQVQFRIGGVPVTELTTGRSASDTPQGVFGWAEANLGVGSVVDVGVFQNTGSAQNITSCHFVMEKIV